jgi:hypothetical protein
MAGKYVELTKAQKEEIRRLTQLANRRIKAAFKAYEKEGMSVVPKEITGGIQLREQWESEKYALSRSVKFESMKDYREQLNFLRSFEVTRPGIKEYTAVHREKTLEAIETSLGTSVPNDIIKKVKKLSAPQLSKFWNSFSDKAVKLGAKYSSTAAMGATLAEFFPEDIAHFNMIENYKADMNYRR